MHTARSSAKIFFILDFVLSFFGRTVYNKRACLDCMGLGSAMPRCSASYAGASFLVIIPIKVYRWKPPRGILFHKQHKRKSPHCFPKQRGDSLFGLCVLTDSTILPQMKEQRKPPGGINFIHEICRKYRSSPGTAFCRLTGESSWLRCFRRSIRRCRN